MHESDTVRPSPEAREYQLYVRRAAAGDCKTCRGIHIEGSPCKSPWQRNRIGDWQVVVPGIDRRAKDGSDQRRGGIFVAGVRHMIEQNVLGRELIEE